MRSRLKYYKEILIFAHSKGYKMMGILDFYNYISLNQSIKPGDKILINRHDVDTSPKTALKMFNIEKSVYNKDGSSSFYFRKTTTNIGVIKEIDSFGYETGFHYETIANFEYVNKFKDKNKLINHFGEISMLFLMELNEYRSLTGTNSYSVASHGDFINVKLGLPNYFLLRDNALRKKANIIVEAYDDAICKFIQARFADHILGSSFTKNVLDELNSGTQVVMILTHPRNWKVDCLENTRKNFRRLTRGIRYH